MTAQVTVYADSGITVNVIAGTPPVDQTAEVTQLTNDLARMTGLRDAAVLGRDGLQRRLDRIKVARAAEEAGEHGADDARTAIDAELA